jgi:hypothetical protein
MRKAWEKPLLWALIRGKRKNLFYPFVRGTEVRRVFFIITTAAILIQPSVQLYVLILLYCRQRGGLW